MNKISKLFTLLLLSMGIFSLQPYGQNPSQRIQPEDLVYLGAFRLPDNATGRETETWDYGGHAMTYFPKGDPFGPDDGFPGSIFAVGHAWKHLVSEISIPHPVISKGRSLTDLSRAVSLQVFSDVLHVGNLEIPRTGLAYLPKQGLQTDDKLYFCWGYHMQEGGPDLTHGWCELDLSRPEVKKGWFLTGLPIHIRNMSTNDYLFEIPKEWASHHTQGMRLATGRFRDGGWSGQGPSLFAIGPWNQGNPPCSGTAIQNVPLLLYSSTYDFGADNHVLNDYHHSDEWSGGAWLTAGDKSAVIFVGTKGVGDCWYGDTEGPNLDCENRGWWSNEFKGQIILYDTDTLVKVAAGMLPPWEPQPYAVMDIDEHLYNVTSIQQKHHVNAACFDREHGHLYIFEYWADGDLPLIHVWKVDSDTDSNDPTIIRKKIVIRK